MDCLVELLKVLRGSSKEAVENINAFHPFKKYMHIKRNLEDELVSIIEQAINSEHKQLILVCGSVGDGKSHLLSYLKNEKKLLDDFYLHNDATESLSPDMTSIETLDQVLKGFRDENIEDGKKERVIVAVNLGTLNNFIDSEIGGHYQKLSQYIDDQEILESYTHESAYDGNNFFQHINFSDYHLYELTKQGNHIDSFYVRQLMNKLVAEHEQNPFYVQYQHCKQCKLANSCPVKHNYELLKEEQVQSAIVDILVETMIKHKIIISTRSLLNFFYDILVEQDFSKNSYMNLNYEDRAKTYIRSLLPNLLYAHPDYSNVLEQVSKLDPMSIRSESVDEIIVRFNILDDVVTLLKENLRDSIYIKALEEMDINRRTKEHKETKKALLELFIRLYRLNGIQGKLAIEDEVYTEFISSVYAYNANNVRELKDLYTNFIDAIFRWNGGNSKKMVGINVGMNQFHYRISQELKIQECIEPGKINSSEVIERFVPYITVTISDEDEERKESIDIDFALFKLIRDIKNGYRPNVKDKNNFVSFVNLIERIYNYGNKKKEVFIESKNTENISRYILKKSKFGFEFERIK
ncbi:MAG: DNA phosphorothioation-dependent restriction protein DptF [Cellulosilyticum sp.]|nr:DNA phosphorothioation-dependent restriction protein DptF [Cellulosilyticum sp.]